MSSTNAIVIDSIASADVSIQASPATVVISTAPADIEIRSTNTAGPAGPAGPPGTLIDTYEFAGFNGQTTVGMAHLIGAWHAFYVNGLRQPPSAYTVTGSVLSFVGLTFDGSYCVFDYIPA